MSSIVLSRDDQGEARYWLRYSRSPEGFVQISLNDPQHSRLEFKFAPRMRFYGIELRRSDTRKWTLFLACYSAVWLNFGFWRRPVPVREIGFILFEGHLRWNLWVDPWGPRRFAGLRHGGIFLWNKP